MCWKGRWNPTINSEEAKNILFGQTAAVVKS